MTLKYIKTGNIQKATQEYLQNNTFYQKRIQQIHDERKKTIQNKQMHTQEDRGHH